MEQNLAEQNIVEIWLRRDVIRWVAGLFAGLFSAGVMIAIGMGIAVSHGMEATYPIKVMGIPLYGAMATELGANAPGIFAGLMVITLLCGFWGVIFAHFTGTNSFFPLLGVGISWGLFSWIFLNNLFLPAFREFFIQEYPKGWAFFGWMGYGISLTSVAFFDKLFRSSKAST